MKTMKHCGAIAATLLILVSGLSLLADQQSDRRGLDLPSGGAGLLHEDDPVPEVIHFYGEAYEGDAFFWCLDRSGSMIGERWEILTKEVNRAVRSLSTRAEFGVVVFNDSVAVLSERPVRSTPPQVERALTWLESLSPHGSTCLGPAGVKTLEICNRSHRENRVVIVVGDGIPTCHGDDTSESSLLEITMANYGRVPVNTILVGPGDGRSFMQSLAQQNGGRFVHIASLDGSL